MNRKTKTSGKQYLNDFTPAVNGDYVYTGGFYRPELEPLHFSKIRSLIIITELISVISVFVAGLLPAAGSADCFYVILPFLAVIICGFVKAWKAVSFFLSGTRVREYVYMKSVFVLPGWTVAETVSAAAVLIAETVFLLINGFEWREKFTVAFICLVALTMIADLLMLDLLRRISWIKDILK